MPTHVTTHYLLPTYFLHANSETPQFVTIKLDKVISLYMCVHIYYIYFLQSKAKARLDFDTIEQYCRYVYGPKFNHDNYHSLFVVFLYCIACQPGYICPNSWLILHWMEYRAFCLIWSVIFMSVGQIIFTLLIEW